MKKQLISKYQLGWIGLRVAKRGRSSKLLKADGWIRLGHADLNNRNAFDWIRPVRTQVEFTKTDWSKLAAAGLEGIAIWLTDAQWGANTSLTDAQWQRRTAIDARE